MTTPSGDGSTQPMHEHAVAALRTLAKPQPKPIPANGTNFPESGPGSGASGFVGMLAKGQISSEDSPMAGTTPQAKPLPRKKHPLYMAREITPDDPQTQPQPIPSTTPTVPSPRVAQLTETPQWYLRTVPIMLVLAGLLAAIGAWAAGAIIYMKTIHPIASSDVHYPLIRWSLDVGNLGGYTPASQIMAWSMLLSLPLAGGIVIIALILRRRIASTS